MLFFRILQHLLPDSVAWRTTVQKTLRKFFEGLTQAPSDARDFVDAVHEDIFPETTRELAEWERQFGVVAPATDAARRQQLAAEWRATGGQSPKYLQDTVRAAGFDVYLHEWWELPAAIPPVARDPRDFTEQPRIGSHRCSSFSSRPRCRVRESPSQARCNRFLANEPRYLVNLNLTHVAPPPVPDDPDAWPYFLYWGGETFGANAAVPAARREELERLVLKLCPSQQWLVMMIDYVTEGP